MDNLRKHSNWISLLFSVLMAFMVLGVYAKTVKINEKDIEKNEIAYKAEIDRLELEYKTEIIRINKILNTHTNGIANAVVTANKAEEISKKCIESNTRVEGVMIEVRTKLASIETDINWIKRRLDEGKKQ